MDDVSLQLNEFFASPSAELRPEVLGELHSILRLHFISPQELFYKWESYCMKMGAEGTKMDLKTARDFKKDIQDTLERQSRGKAHGKQYDKRIGPTPRSTASGDVFGMLDSLVPNTPRSGALGGFNAGSAKRKSNFESPLSKASKSHPMGSPGDSKTLPVMNGARSFKFPERQNAGKIEETLNDHIDIPEPPIAPPSDPRIKLKANNEIAKFSYKPMAMKLSEASEILDDRIDEFLGIIQAHHKLEDGAFGNPCIQSTSEIVAVGRIACDSSEGRLNSASLVLETSRRIGAGIRVPLKIDSLKGYGFFPGQMVAVRGNNASGEFFTANDVLEIPLLPSAASLPSELDVHNARLVSSPEDDPDISLPRPLTTLIASGPYTTDENLDFAPFEALLSKAQELRADSIILFGPFIDIEHPLVRIGDFELPPTARVEPDQASLTDVFRHYISQPLSKLAAALPSISIVLIPSLRDVVSKHVSWPQDRFNKRELGLPKQASCVTSPMMLSMNETVFGMCSLDVWDMLRKEECCGGVAKQTRPLDRWTGMLIEQRHFCPLFPPPGRDVPQVPTSGAGPKEAGEDDSPKIDWLPLGTMLDISYLKLADWMYVKPDILIMPSVLPPSTRVVSSVLAINPGTLSKKRGAGTYARLTVCPLTVSDAEREAGQYVGHRLWERARVDIVRI